MEKPIKIRLHVLSPIHIGCDDVYEPTSFVIDEQKKKLIEFDPLEFVKSLKPQESDEFSRTASGDNILAIFKAIKRLYKPTIKGREVEITDYLVSHYKKILGMGTFDKKAVINQFKSKPNHSDKGLCRANSNEQMAYFYFDNIFDHDDFMSSKK